MTFTTKDRDNDRWDNNCAESSAGGNVGGWWYNACSHILLNNQYKKIHAIHFSGSWYADYALSFTEMKIRPLNCKT